MNADELGAYTCEVMVLDVHLKANYGPTLKLRFADKDQAQRFRKGMRLAIACVEIGDDEEVVPETRERPIQRKPYTLSQLAGMLGNDPMYWKWLADVHGHQCENPEHAAQWTREACGVQSRGELDHNRVAGETWRRLLADYDQWRQVGDET